LHHAGIRLPDDWDVQGSRYELLGAAGHAAFGDVLQVGRHILSSPSSSWSPSCSMGFTSMGSSVSGFQAQNSITNSVNPASPLGRADESVGHMLSVRLYAWMMAFAPFNPGIIGWVKFCNWTTRS